MALKLTALFILLAAFEISFIVSGADDDYTYIKSTKHLYKLHKHHVTWREAVSGCKDQGGQLFIPENESELKEVLNAVDVVNGYWIWVGISDLKNTNQFRTTDGRPVSEVFNNWEPRERGNNDLCAILLVTSRTFRASDCGGRSYYICKKVLWSAELIEDAKTAFAATMRSQMSSQTAALGSLVEVLQRQVADQAAAWALMAQAVANQTAALERQAEAMEKRACDENGQLVLRSLRNS